MRYIPFFLMVINYVTGFGVNNFRFIGKNTIYGDKLPQRISITGTYFFEPEDYESFDLQHVDFFTNGIVTRGINETPFSIGHLTGDGPYLCSKDILEKLTTITQTTFEKIDTNVKKLNSINTQLLEIKNGTPHLASEGLTFLANNPTYPVDINRCSKINITLFSNNTLLENNYKNRIFTFNVVHTFDRYGPILFVDHFGISTFIYKQKLQAQDQARSSGNPLRFCSGTNYNTQIYTPEPRPVCPSEVSEKREHKKGVITVFKPNIVPITKVVGRCTKIKTKVYSLSTFVFCCHKGKSGTRTSTNEPVTKEECEHMFKSKSAPDTGELLKNINENDEHTTYFTDRNKDFNFDGFTSRTRYVIDYQLDISIMKISTPMMTMSTPWTMIPRKHLYSNFYKTNEYSIVWDTITKNNLCMFVPRLTAEVEAVRYPRGDSLMEESSSSDATETIFFTSKTSMATWDVDDTMEITDLTKFNCINKKNAKEVIYLNKNGDLLKWYPMKKLRNQTVDKDLDVDLIGSDQYDYAHSSFTELIVKEDGSAVTITDPIGQSAKPTSAGVGTLDAANITGSEKDNKPKDTTILDIIKKTTAEDTTTTKELLSYLNYKNVQQENENIHQRLINNCKQNQVDDIVWFRYSYHFQLFLFGVESLRTKNYTTFLSQILYLLLTR